MIWKGDDVQEQRSVRDGEASLGRRDWRNCRAEGTVSAWNSH